MTFPADEVLICRGKYATLRSDARARMKELHTRMMAITDQARVLLRFDEEADQAATVFAAMQRQLEATGECLEALATLQAGLDELRPSAWGDTKEIT